MNASSNVNAPIFSITHIAFASLIGTAIEFETSGPQKSDKTTSNSLGDQSTATKRLINERHEKTMSIIDEIFAPNCNPEVCELFSSHIASPLNQISSFYFS